MPKVKRQTKPIDANITYTVCRLDDEKLQQVSPLLYHREIAEACLREHKLKDSTAQIETQNYHPDDISEGGFSEALGVISRESRWLDLTKNDKRTFSALCEGWATLLPLVALDPSTTASGDQQ